MTRYEFLEKARNIHGYKYNYPDLPIKILNSDIINIEYNGVIFSQKVYKHINLGRCPEKKESIKTNEQFIKEAIEIWGDKYDYSLVDYQGANKKIKIIYDGVIFEQTPSQHLLGKKIEKTLTVNNFIRKSKIKYGDKYDYSKISDDVNKKLKGNEEIMIGYKGEYYLQTPYNHLNSGKPENKYLSSKKSIDRFITESNFTHDYKYNYNKVNYKTNQNKVIITCYIHGDFEQTPNSHLQGNGCPFCKNETEKEVIKFLNKNKIFFDKNHKFEDCKNKYQLPFDFYITSKRTCIEIYDKQHYMPIDQLGGLKIYELLKQNDKIKEIYCEENYINLIIIRYDQINIIEDILEKNIL